MRLKKLKNRIGTNKLKKRQEKIKTKRRQEYNNIMNRNIAIIEVLAKLNKT